MKLPDPPSRGSFWSLGNRPVTGWDIGVKVLVWSAVAVAAAFFVYLIS
jgi:hypothetical protein